LQRQGKVLKVLLAFCGTLDFRCSYTTIGDIMAVYNVALKLKQYGIDFDIAYQNHHLLDFNHFCVDIRQIIPNNYSDLLYVCGPISHTAKKLSEIFIKQKRTAIGVSAATAIPTDFFHKVYVRDSQEETNFDLAIADIGFPHLHINEEKRRPGLAICLVGSQSEYGINNGSNLFAQELAVLLNDINKINKVFVNTLIKPSSKNPLDAELDIQCCSITLTNRMHGALLSIYHRLPVIAIDQIRHGAKVTRILNKINWPVFNFFEFEAKSFKKLIDEYEHGWNMEWMEDSRRLMIEKSRLALDESMRIFLNE
jgi:hypothetical protein